MTSDSFASAVAEFEHLPIPGGIFELDGTIVAANEAATVLLARPAAQLVGRKAWDFAPGAEHIWPEVIAGAQKSNFYGDITLATPIGPRAIHYVVTLRTVAARSVALMFAIETKSANDEDGSHHLESLGLVAGGIAHDFNNQLVSVLAEASAARDFPGMTDRARDSLLRIEAAAQRMAALTRQLLAYAGRGRIVTEILDPDAFIRDMRDELQQLVRVDQTLSIRFSPSRIAIKADRGMLRDVILNLIVNASEALLTDGGAIAISSAVASEDNAQWWKLEVRDHGVGMDALTVKRVFDPFFTTKPDRRGLGLSAAHGIVRRLGGEITVESERGDGTTFTVRLPVVAGVEPKPQRARTVSETSVSLRGVTILVADDEPSVRATIRRVLERRGANVVVASDGYEAEARLADATYQLVLLDVMMPGRTGYQLLPLVRRAQPSAKIMLMSGFTDGRSAAGDDEPDEFLEKPFTAKQMDDAVDRVLANQPR